MNSLRYDYNVKSSRVFFLDERYHFGYKGNRMVWRKGIGSSCRIMEGEIHGSDKSVHLPALLYVRYFDC